MAKSSMGGASFSDYALVADRITLFYLRFPTGRIVTELHSRSDVEITFRIDLQIERAVTREELEHVIQEPDAGGDPVTAAPLERQRHSNPGLGRLAIDHPASHNISSMASRQRRVCSTMPVVTRMQPAHPGSADLSRM